MPEQFAERAADDLKSTPLAQLLPMLQRAIIESLEAFLRILNIKEESVRTYAQDIQARDPAFKCARDISNALPKSSHGVFEALGPLANIPIDIAQYILSVNAEVSDARRERLCIILQRMIALIREEQELFTETGCMQAGRALNIKGILHRALGAIPDEEHLAIKVLRDLHAGMVRRAEGE